MHTTHTHRLLDDTHMAQKQNKTNEEKKNELIR